jgi:general secretion pathway protein K
MRRSPQHQYGAALLTAMLTVTLVATFASAALWQQWRSVEIESAERSRTQMQWVLNGALDWARLILQEDARSGGAEVDHLSEPWALPLQEARLSSFLALDKDNTDDAMDAFLSGQISDQQGLLNVRNLVTLQNGKPAASDTAVQAFERLFGVLNLPLPQLQLLVNQLIASDTAAAAAASTTAVTEAKPAAQPDAPLQPYRLEQLVWLGLPAQTVRALAPYAVLLPVATPLNLNTASAEVLRAALPNFDLGRAQQLVAQRATRHFATVDEAFKAAGIATGTTTQSTAQTANRPDAKDFSVATHYFAVRGRLRLGDSTVQEVSLIERNGPTTRVVWRQREVLLEATTASLQ